MNNTVYLVHASDKYDWVIDKFVENHEKHFKNMCLDKIILTESITKNWEGFKTECVGKNKSWSDGLIDWLLYCKYDNIIYVHEDYFLTSDTNNVLFFDLLDIFIKNNYNLLKICGSWSGSPEHNQPDKKPFINKKTHCIKSNDDSKSNDRFYDIYEYNNNLQYLVSHQTSIWDKDFLLSTLWRGWTPWDHELTGTEILRYRNVKIHTYIGEPPIPYCEVINRGKIRPGCEHYFQNMEDYNGKIL